MVMTDPISDLLTRIRNANMAKYPIVKVPMSKIKLEIVKILKDEGFVRDFKVTKDKFPQIKVRLKFDDDNQPVITCLRKISKPSRRVYSSWQDLPRVLNNLGIAIVSTSKGILSDRESRRLKVGGEILCFVW
jgi:small subunit ribosomal protein S8